MTLLIASPKNPDDTVSFVQYLKRTWQSLILPYVKFEGVKILSAYANHTHAWNGCSQTAIVYIYITLCLPFSSKIHHITATLSACVIISNHSHYTHFLLCFHKAQLPPPHSTMSIYAQSQMFPFLCTLPVV